MDVRFGLWRKLSAEELMLLNCGVGEDSSESLGLQGSNQFILKQRVRWPGLWNQPHYSTLCHYYRVVQSLSQVRLFATPWAEAWQAFLSITNSRTYSNSCPLSWWCQSTISSSAVPFSSCLQSFPAWGSFPVSQFFSSGGQSIRVSASAVVLPYSRLISFRMDCLHQAKRLLLLC